MAAEMRDRVESGGEDIGVEALNPPRLRELLAGELGKHSVGFVDYFLKLRQNVARRSLGVVGEFGGAIADVGRATDAADDPLAHVAGKVEYEVRDAVHLLGGAMPDLLIG